jgi:hypothetical protein
MFSSYYLADAGGSCGFLEVPSSESSLLFLVEDRSVSSSNSSMIGVRPSLGFGYQLLAIVVEVVTSELR